MASCHVGVNVTSPEIGRLRRRQRLAARIANDFGQIAAPIGFWIAVHWVIVEDAYDLRQFGIPLI